VAEPTTTAPATDLWTDPPRIASATGVARDPDATAAAVRPMMLKPAIGWSRVREGT
jgi:hypothetical protein